MDLIQLYSAIQRVVQSLKTSGLMPALKNYRGSLRGQANADRASIESVLIEASNAYIEKSAMYTEQEISVVNLLHLAELGKASYWLDMTSNIRSVEVRLAQAVSAYSKLMFATGHLPGLLSLVRETSAMEGLRTDEPDSGTLLLRLYDAVEPASSPDRMSRLIDAVDLIYSACSAMSDARPDSLRLMSVAGVSVRSVIFHGDVQAINAVRKVIAQLNESAARLHQDELYSVDAIAAEMPLLDAIDELEHLDALSPDVAANAARDAREGAIMVLECGAQLVDHDAVANSSSYIPASVIAKLDADGKSFDNIDSRIGESIDARYDEVYERERLKLLNESPEHDGSSITSDAANASGSPITSVYGRELASSSRGERSPGKSELASRVVDNRKDSIDELIVDLNRLYSDNQ